ncbi:MAG: hypothetical protein FWH40_09735 [Coriobacteriia bacterium]|nr:hypothetical protein [Coriobacteriia bacterium]
MTALPDIILDHLDIGAVLIVQFLLSFNDLATYELLYYKFQINVEEDEASHYIEYPAINDLPEEITSKIRPKAIAAKGDVDFIRDAIVNYLSAMDTMLFESERRNPKLIDAELFYQVY